MNANDPRYKLLQLLKKYKPIDPADQAQADRIHVFVETTPDCFERSHVAGHVTGSAWLVDKSKKRVLLTHHKKLGKWLQLGGHADGDHDPIDVAIKEAKEESGIDDIQPVSTEIFDVDVHLIPARGTEPEHFHYDIRFALETDSPENFVVSNESNQLAWVNIERLENVSKERSLLRMRRKWLQTFFE